MGPICTKKNLHNSYLDFLANHRNFVFNKAIGNYNFWTLFGMDWLRSTLQTSTIGVIAINSSSFRTERGFRS